MDEHDFDQILHTDFHPNTAPPPPPQPQPQTTVHSPQHDEVAQTLEGQEQKASGSTEGDVTQPQPEQEQDRDQEVRFMTDEDGNYIAGPVYSAGPPRSKSEAKQRQREQNRQAAIRSREKKNVRFDKLEKHVEVMTENNEKLRARLNQLLAERPGPSSHESTSLPPFSSQGETRLDVPHIDEQYFRKVTTNLEAAKSSLLYREIELEHLRDPERHPRLYEQPDPAGERRAKVVQAIGNVAMLKAETKSMESMARNLSLERQNLIQERDRITREVEARMAIKQINGVGEEGSGGVDSVERVLLEVRGWLDETIANWEEPQETVITDVQPLQNLDAVVT